MRIGRALSICAITLAIVLQSIPGTAAVKDIVLATLSWEPYYGETLENGGYITEIAREAFKRVDYHLDVEWLPWKRALEEAKQGSYDGLLGAYWSSERERYFAYSEPVDSVVMSFFSRADKTITYSSLEDLAPYRIGIIRGGVHSEAFDSATFLTKDEGTGPAQNIQKLASGRIDLLLDARNITLYHLQTRFPEFRGKLVEVSPPLQVNQLFVAISRQVPNHSRIIEDFNRGLAILKDDGTFDRILHKHGFSLSPAK